VVALYTSLWTPVTLANGRHPQFRSLLPPARRRSVCICRYVVVFPRRRRRRRRWSSGADIDAIFRSFVTELGCDAGWLTLDPAGRMQRLHGRRDGRTYRWSDSGWRAVYLKYTWINSIVTASSAPRNRSVDGTPSSRGFVPAVNSEHAPQRSQRGRKEVGESS